MYTNLSIIRIGTVAYNFDKIKIFYLQQIGNYRATEITINFFVDLLKENKDINLPDAILKFEDPCVLCTAYTTFYEYIFCNLPTFLLPPLILGLNWYVANIWFVYATISVTTDHSGYIFFSKSIHHANHHKYTSYNYGSYFLDFLNNSLFGS